MIHSVTLIYCHHRDTSVQDKGFDSFGLGTITSWRNIGSRCGCTSQRFECKYARGHRKR